MDKKNIICFKPDIDKRDYGILKSKDYDVEISAICINEFDEILKYVEDNKNIRTIFTDEAQMLKGNVSILTYLSIVEDMDIYISGLNMTSEQEPFLVMPQLLSISDEVKYIKASCFDCGRDASYTYYDGKKTNAIKVGDRGYIPLCSRCLKKRRGKVKLKKMLISENIIKKD